MLRMMKLAIVGLAAYGGYTLWDRFGRDALEAWQGTNGTGARTPVGRDTPTGTDPFAKYTQPGYEDKSFGQAVKADQELADQLVREERGSYDAASRRFDVESAGAPALARQRNNS
jgi:hypothetical protein